MYQLLADTVLVLHTGIALFVVGALPAILVGGRAGWGWVRNRTFRIVHLGAIGLIVVQAWGGALCALTTLEMRLRRQAGAATYDGSFVQHWFQRILYYDAPDWVFVTAYTVFAVAVLAAWIVYPPGRFGPRRGARRCR